MHIPCREEKVLPRHLVQWSVPSEVPSFPSFFPSTISANNYTNFFFYVFQQYTHRHTHTHTKHDIYHCFFIGNMCQLNSLCWMSSKLWETTFLFSSGWKMIGKLSLFTNYGHVWLNYLQKLSKCPGSYLKKKRD